MEIDKKGRTVIDRDPDSVLDYSADFTEWLAASADSLASVVAIVDGVTVAPARPAPAVSGALATVWIAGGALDAETMPSLTFRVTTAGGRTEDRTLYFRMKAL